MLTSKWLLASRLSLTLACAALVCCGSSTPAPLQVASASDATTLDTAGTTPGVDATSQDITGTTPKTLGYKPCSKESRVGGFRLELAEKYTGVQGQVLDGMVPGNIPEVVQTVGSCSLLRGRSLFCNPSCVPGETCDEKGACITYPKSHPVGTVTISGMKAALSMKAKWGNNYTNSGTLPHPGFDEGAAISLQASGGDYQAFELLGQGVAPVVVSSQSKKLVIDGAKAIDLKWTPPAKQGAVKVHIEVNINNHGTTSAWITCDVDDNGAFSIPVELVGALQKLGVSGFPSLLLSRRSADSASITPGCVDLLVVADAEMTVAVAGLTSCTKDSQCPKGQSCQVDLSCK